MLKKIIASLFVLGIVFPLAVSAVQAEEVHQVQSGETLWLISVDHDVSLQELLEANDQISNPDLIYPGQDVTIPGQSAQPVSQPSDQSAEESASLSEFEQEVIRLTNEERESNGLAPLEIDEDVSEVARAKSEDMRDQGYFSHQSPTYGSPFDMLSTYDVSYRSAGENIAAGQQSPEQVVQSWMNSQGHRENILNSQFTHIGVGHAEGGSYGQYWTQMFISH